MDNSQVSIPLSYLNELYEHRNMLFCALMNAHRHISWWSPFHDDGTMFDGQFIGGIDLPSGTITYHMPVAYMKHLGCVPARTAAPKWDGHTPEDVIERIEAFLYAQEYSI